MIAALLHIGRWRRLQRLAAARADVFDDAITQDNLRRLCWVGAIVLPLNLVHVLIFWGFPPQDKLPHTAQWANLLGWAHLAMMLCLGLLVVLSYTGLKGRLRSGIARSLSTYFLLAGFGFSILVVCIDQLVTTAITPFLTGTLLMSVVLTKRPSRAIPIYLLALLLFCWAIGLTQPEPAQLISSRVNGLMAVGMGLVLSFSRWRFVMERMLLTRKLERRQRLLEFKNRELSLLAARDGLTGLLNRSEFMRQADAELARALRYHRPLCVVVGDLDHFKHINDEYGHPVGDQALRQVGAVLRSAVRGTDIVGRLGGEEFIILLPETHAAIGMQIAEKVRARVEASTVSTRNGRSVTVTISLGVAVQQPGEDLGLSVLYKAADRALYQAKQNGRNRVELADQPMFGPSSFSGGPETLPGGWK